MPSNKQETREEKTRRQIANLTRALDQEPSLRSRRQRRAELERELEQMPAAERLAAVPREETERERRELIKTYGELIADCEKELAQKRQQHQEEIQRSKAQIKELRQHRSKLLRQGA